MAGYFEHSFIEACIDRPARWPGLSRNDAGRASHPLTVHQWQLADKTGSARDRAGENTTLGSAYEASTRANRHPAGV